MRTQVLAFHAEAEPGLATDLRGRSGVGGAKRGNAGLTSDAGRERPRIRGELVKQKQEEQLGEAHPALWPQKDQLPVYRGWL